MIGKRAIIAMTLLLFVAACFISGPAISGEHPWDSDIPDSEALDDPNWEDIIKARDEDKTDSTDSSGGSSSGMPADDSSDRFMNYLIGVWTDLVFDFGPAFFAR